MAHGSPSFLSQLAHLTSETPCIVYRLPAVLGACTASTSMRYTFQTHRIVHV
jgi:hypothetical protein